MDITEYLGLHGHEMEPHLRTYVVGLTSARHAPERHIRGGVLPFTLETASSWGGPFEGGYAAFRLTDHRESLYVVVRKGQPRPLLTAVGDQYQAKHPERSQEMVTTAKPFELRVYGNDDTSYTKFYASEEEALQELALFEGSGPLDFLEFVDGFGFVFTN